MEFTEIRRLTIIAMFSDDYLMEKFALKGGNALDIVHQLSGRASVDIDLSMEGDFGEDLGNVSERIRVALTERFDSAGFSVFDFKFARRPEVESPGQDPKWGGYIAEFKVIEKAKFSQFDGRTEDLRRNSFVVGPGQQRIFRIDISKFEFCEPKIAAELDDFTIYVYTLPMLAVEKLRAICQQLPQYTARGYKTARARDFFDIYRIVKYREVDLTSAENLSLIEPIFSAKNVSLDFLGRIGNEREFHRPDWDSVVLSSADRLEPFDYYFDFVVALINQLQAARIK